MAWVVPAIQAATAIYSASRSRKSQDEANRYNEMLQKEQRDWEEMMSNTAIQRRKADLIKAGGNPALAFTTGSEASTPNIAPARVEPKETPESNRPIGEAAAAVAQILNIKAQTRLTNANAAGKEMENNVNNPNMVETASINMDLLRMKKQMAEKEYDEVLPAKIANLAAQAKASEAAASNSAAQAAKINKTIDEMETLLKQQVRAGEIDIAALENVAAMGGVEAQKATGIINTLVNGVRSLAITMRK